MRLSNKFGNKTDSQEIRSSINSLIAGLHGSPIDSQSNWSLGPFRDQPGFLLLDNLDHLNKSYLELASSALPISGTTYSTLSRVDVNYFHWLVESCSQLLALRKFIVLHPQPITILHRLEGPTFITDSINLLFDGIDYNLQPFRGNVVKCEKLLCAVYPEYSTNINGKTVNLIRDLLSINVRIENPNSQLIYVKRKVGSWRYVVNDDALCSTLMGLGFQVVQSELLTLAEQMALFRNAKVIVGMHGAGLTNLMFAQNPTVIELRGAYGGDDYLRLCAALQHKHVLFACDDQDHNIIVDIPRLTTEIQLHL